MIINMGRYAAIAQNSDPPWESSNIDGIVDRARAATRGIHPHDGTMVDPWLGGR